MVSGVRSSWLASATNRRIRACDRSALSSEAARAANAVSMSVSMLFRAVDSWPIAVRGSATDTRWVKSPAAMAAAVVSTLRGGLRLARTMA